MDRQIAIVTDSAADLPPGVAEELGVSVVPLRIRFGEQELRDGIDITTEEFWERCTSGNQLPATVAPSVGDFGHTFSSLLKERGYSSIVCVTLSSKVSATYQAAAAAAADASLQGMVEVVDSGTLAIAQGMVVISAAEAAATESQARVVVERVRDIAGRTRLYGVVETLEFLRRGGRIGSVAALVGSALSFKPVIEVRGGVVELESRQRTRRRALDYLIDKVSTLGKVEAWAITHSMAPDVAEVVARLQPLLGASEPIISLLGPVVGTHVGPGTIGVAVRLSNQ